LTTARNISPGDKYAEGAPASEIKKRSARAGGHFIIEIMNGPEDGRIIECPVLPVTIGRSSENPVHLPYDHLVSRHHARIERKGNKLVLLDLNSTNGTYVREQRVRDETTIEVNKLFRTGATLLTIRLRATGD